MIKSFFTVLYLFFVALTIFIFYSIEVPPDTHWVFTFLPLLIPVVIIINIIFLIIWIFRKRHIFLLSILTLLIGWKFFPRTFHWSFGGEEEGKIKILSYNVRVFNSYAHYSQEGKAAEKIIKFASDYESDIKCFQEFYDSRISSVKNKPHLFKTIKQIQKKTPYYHFVPSSVVIKEHFFGLVIFSKFPIVGKGEIKFPKATFNQAIYADIVIGKDTLRVYNIHLQSMSINEKQLPGKDSKEYSQRIKQLAEKLKWGAQYRSGQVNALVDHIEKCPYRILLCGDLNDTPYSYCYESLREKLENSFELKGKGFGFSYNGKLFFLRIDNIFSDKSLNIHTFKTLNTVKYSDHYPLEATFNIKE